MRLMADIEFRDSISGGLDWLDKAVKAGDPTAQSRLGQYYYDKGEFETSEPFLGVGCHSR